MIIIATPNSQFFFFNEIYNWDFKDDRYDPAKQGRTDGRKLPVQRLGSEDQTKNIMFQQLQKIFSF